jgi:ATP adenylyltransferase
VVSCPLCRRLSEAAYLLEGVAVVALFDAYPVSQGHTLIIPKRHVASFFDLNQAEQVEMLWLLDQVRRRLENLYQPRGFNVGVNIGEAAGQTIDHAHLHVIPRYAGDVQDPRGGIRNVIPAKARYWEN